MAKDKFKRANVKSTILKNVIIRMDFIGLTDIVGCVNSLKSVMHGKFNKFTLINTDNYNIELPREISMGIPNVNLEKRIFYQFSDSQIGTSKADFMLGADFAAMKVECDSRYEGCDDYIKLMADAIDCILRFDTFIAVQRLGLRKVDVAFFDNEADMDSSLENPIWDNYKRNKAYLPLKKTYSDLLYQKNVKTVFHIQRTVQEVEGNERKIYQYKFDIDAYKNGSLIVKDDFSTVKRIEKMISEQLNEPVFNYFIDTFTEHYIDEFYNG